MIILAMQNDMDLYECLNCAYDEIKGRTVRVGDVCKLGDNEFYIAREVTEIKYSFVDVVTKLKGYSVTELTPLEIKNQRRLNELGWSVC